MSHRDYWLHTARLVARRVNIGWWLDRLAAPLVVSSVVGSCVILIVRRDAPATPALTLALSVAGALILLAALAWLAARRQFEAPAQSLVRLEASLCLRNALSAASAGVAPWPPPPVRVSDGLSWNIPRLVTPLLGSALLLAAAIVIPVSAIAKPTQATPEEPLAWKKIDADLQRFHDEKLADESYLEDMRKRLDELRSRKAEDWFSHSSLEATDSLKKSHQAETKRVERELSRAGKALEGLQQNTSGDSEKERLAGEFDQALQGLQSGSLKPNPALLDKLKQLDPKNLGNLSPEQLEALNRNLRYNAKAMQNAAGDGESGQDYNDELMAGDDKDGKGGGGDNSDGEGDPDGNGYGNGGVDRGPGHAPNPLGKEHQKLNTGEATPLESKDLSRATPGDLLQIQDGAHQIDKTPQGPTAGGSVNQSGDGGKRVWKDSPDPAEQNAIKRFFE